MQDLKVAIEFLFNAYNRPADYEKEKAFLVPLENYPIHLVAKAIVGYANSGQEKFPTVGTIIRRVIELQKEESEQGQKNIIEHDQWINKMYKKAIDAGWSLAQRDELVDLMERGINRQTGAIKQPASEISKNVAELVAKVKAFRLKVETARAHGEPEPDEHGEDWAWALPKPGDLDWDPATESLAQAVKRIGAIRKAQGPGSGDMHEKGLALDFNEGHWMP